METGVSVLKNDGNPVLNVLNKPSISSSSSKKKNSARNGNQYISSVLPDRFPSKKRLHPVSSCPYKQKVSGGVTLQQVYNVGQNNVSAFTQRVMSAKLLRVKQLQNQLSETQNQLNELVNENRLLRTLQKRQAVALQRFEGSQDQLPQLIKSHNEEIRILTAKIKQYKEKYGDLENRLKRKDAELNYLKEHHKHLLLLSQDKQLVDRDKLAKKVESLEAREREQNEKIQLLTRRLELEGKNYRHQLSTESNKLKETQNDLKSALGTINNLKAALEAKEKYVNCTMPKKYQKTMEHLMQNTHVSLPIPPRVSIRQPDKFSDSALPNEEDSSSDSDVSYSKMFEHKDSLEGDDNRSPSELNMKNEKPFENNVRWGNEHDSKSNSSTIDPKERKSGKGSNQSDDSLDGLKLNRGQDGKKKKRLFTNVIGVGREITSNYSFGSKVDTRSKDGSIRSHETLGRLKPRSRSLSKDSKNEAIRANHRVNPSKKGSSSSKHYLADRESSSDEHHKVKNNNNEPDNFQMNSSLASFHQEMEYELEQVIRNESSGVSPDNDSDEVYENCEPALDREINPLSNDRSVKFFPTENKSLEKFSKLSWSQMKNELPQSKEEILNILDQAHPELNRDPITLDEEKKTNLLRMLNDIDQHEETLDNAALNKKLNEDVPLKISKTKKKHILQEIFKS